MIDFSCVADLIETGFITKRPHPWLDLFILNYTARTQHERHWTLETLACRGLVINGKNEIVARGLPKFFNYSELPCLPEGGPLTVYEKMDGSLIQVFTYQGETIVTSRGSFDSLQARVAEQILDWMYPYCVWPEDRLYLFELISPENRIVVDYGETHDLYHLATFHGPTGEELPLLHEAFLRPRTWSVDRFEDVFQLPQPANEEGYVVKWPNGFRVKVKFAEYVRLHQLLTGLTPGKIWECMARGDRLDVILEAVPDEFFVWARGICADLWGKYVQIEEECRVAFEHIAACRLTERKQVAHLFKQEPYPAVLFKMLDGHDPAPLIWKLVKPDAGRPFRCGEPE